MHRAVLLFALAFAAGPACSTLKNDLAQAETAYNQANYEDALHWFDALEDEEAKMSADDRAKFRYLRGMSSYRLGKHDEALYHLSLAREMVATDRATLEGDRMAEMTAVLAELTPTDASFHARAEGSGGEAPALDAPPSDVSISDAPPSDAPPSDAPVDELETPPPAEAPPAEAPPAP